MLEFKLIDEACFSEQIVLDTIPYIFTFSWNTTGFWTLSVSNRNNAILISGITLVLDLDLLAGHPDLGLPEGQLYAVDFSGNTENISRYDFVNKRQVKLIYLEKGELI